MRTFLLLFLALWTAPVLPASAAQLYDLPGEALSRPDLGYDFLSARSPAPTSYPEVTVEKRVPDPAVLTATAWLQVGERSQTEQTCRTPAACNYSSSLAAYVPAHAFLYVGAIGPDLPNTGERIVVGLWQPDDVRRKKGENRSFVKIKQKASVFVARVSFDTASPSFDSTAAPVPGCKGQAKVTTKTEKNELSAKFKVRCKQASIDAAFPGSSGEDLRETLELIGLESLDLDARGFYVLPPP